MNNYEMLINELKKMEDLKTRIDELEADNESISRHVKELTRLVENLKSKIEQLTVENQGLIDEMTGTKKIKVGIVNYEYVLTKDGDEYNCKKLSEEGPIKYVLDMPHKTVLFIGENNEKLCFYDPCKREYTDSLPTNIVYKLTSMSSTSICVSYMDMTDFVVRNIAIANKNMMF